jgi:two-component system, OmpR family, phosphate regulon sensor histidine kinase PhoR
VSWLLSRFLVAIIAAAVGGMIAVLAAGPVLVASLAGAVVGFAAVVAYDSLRAWRLMEWLRGSQAQTAPRDTGHWGEIAYRVERSLRGLERSAEVERTRLEQFVAAMEASPNGVLLLDGNDQIEWCNASAADHFGLDPQRDRRQRVTNLIRAPAFVDYLQAGEFAAPVTFPHGQGRGSIQVLVRRYGADSRLILSQDQTERERADAMRRDFVANVSHEIRTPLTVLAGFLETMRNLPLSEAERKRVVTLMSQQADRMANLVSDLLALARLEGSARPGANHWVTLASLFAQSEAEGRALSAGRHVLTFADAADVEIAGIERELQSAIGNLVANAVRYTPDGGRVDVVWRQRDDGSCEISVTDTGRGIAREHLSRLTERFYRVDASRSRDSGGTGLGLATVKHVAQRHGGELDIQSEPGRGSTFRLVLPAARVRRRAAGGEAVDALGPARPASLPAR